MNARGSPCRYGRLLRGSTGLVHLVVQHVWVDAENVPIRTMKVSRKRAKIGARAGPIWHYVAQERPLHVRAYMRVRRTSGIATSCHPGPDVVTDAGLRVEEVRGSLDQVGVYVVVVPVRTVKAPLKTGQNAAPGGISRPQLALRGTTWHKPRALDLAGVGTPPRFPPARLAARARAAARAAPPLR